MSNIHNKHDSSETCQSLEGLEVTEITLYRCVPLGLDCLLDSNDDGSYLAVASNGPKCFSEAGFLNQLGVTLGQLVRPCRTAKGG